MPNGAATILGKGLGLGRGELWTWAGESEVKGDDSPCRGVHISKGMYLSFLMRIEREIYVCLLLYMYTYKRRQKLSQDKSP